MAQRKHVYVRSPRAAEEFWEARFARYNLKPRFISNPRAAAAVRDVLDQIPRVKADLEKRHGQL